MGAGSRPRQEGLFRTLGAAISGLIAGAVSTAIFLWVYGFDIYRSAFYNRNLPVLTLHAKYLVFGMCTLVWFLVFWRWIFKKSKAPHPGL
jgi:hypothetical protein